ncbi:hypothetical protein GCU60_12590 [Blastococcus saxobsidens]|uniref:Uncharacterized protein n=1 Tax=Blastococcus saxobsidens TaxID=138336 RepID=A0A6L9W3D0_9ACTN|nr:hypothetical protein [Blastococcus saxobsidens]
MTTSPGAPAWDETLAALAERCVRSALPALKAAIDAGVEPKANSNFVRIERDPDGTRVQTSNDPPPNYASLLEEDYVATTNQVPYESLDGYGDFHAYLRSVPAYFEHLSGGEILQQRSWAERFFGMKASEFIGRLVDRHIHIAGWSFDADVFADHYLLLERGLLGQSADGQMLTVDVLVPLYGLSFDSPAPDGSVRIEELGDELLAACWPGSQLERYDEQLLLGATHLWVHPQVPVTLDPVSGFADPTGLNLAGLDQLLQVGAISAVNFGIKHVLYRPNNWAEWWIAGLPAAGRWSWTHERSSTRLKDLATRSRTEPLSQDQTQRRYATLAGAPHEIQLAARRLLSAACRSDPIDAVVDACIGIEALVGDSESNEITYKLALRTSAVLAYALGADPKLFFTTVKNLYARRSKIVHGKLKANDNNTVKAFGETFSANAIGSVVLSALLGAVLDKPELIGRIANDDLVLSLISGQGRAEHAADQGGENSS